MNILAIDSAVEIISAALLTDKGVFESQSGEPRSHSEVFISLIDSVLGFAGLKITEVDIFAYMRGPGSWTGLRIGFAAASGLALPLQKKLLGLPTLDCIASPHSFFEGLVVPVLDARQQRFFCALYHKDERISPYLDAAPETLASIINEKININKKIMLTGNAAGALFERLKELCPESCILLDAHFKKAHAIELLKCAEKEASKAQEAGGSPYLEAESGLLYLRKSDAEENEKGKRRNEK